MTACIFLFYILQMTDGPSMCSILANNRNPNSNDYACMCLCADVHVIEIWTSTPHVTCLTLKGGKVTGY